MAVMATYGLLPFIVETVTATEQVTPILTDVTLPCSFVLFAAVVWWERRYRLLAPLYGFSAVVGALALFEVSWHVVGATSPGFGYPVNQAGWIFLGTWSAFGFATAAQWRVSKPIVVLGMLFVGVVAAWRLDGYPQLATGGWPGLWFNAGAKALAFLFMAALVAPPFRERSGRLLLRSGRP
jgi:hypothetical protein